MSDKTASESFISPYLERPLRSIDEVLRSLPKARRLHLMNIINGSGSGDDAAPSEPADESQAGDTLERRRA